MLPVILLACEGDDSLPDSGATTVTGEQLVTEIHDYTCVDGQVEWADATPVFPASPIYFQHWVKLEAASEFATWVTDTEYTWPSGIDTQCQSELGGRVVFTRLAE